MTSPDLIVALIPQMPFSLSVKVADTGGGVDSMGGRGRIRTCEQRDNTHSHLPTICLPSVQGQTMKRISSPKPKQL